MSLSNAASLIHWVREELGGDVFLEPVPGQPGMAYIALRAPRLKNRRTREQLFAALDRNGAAVVQTLAAERGARGRAPAGAERAQWASDGI
jgi:hypothetical protein